MYVTCEKCGKHYNDEFKWTICPHRHLWTLPKETFDVRYALTDEASKIIENNFTYHAPHGDQATRYERLRAAAKALALEIHHLCPQSRERAVAITNLEQVMFWANAAVARNEPNAAAADGGNGETTTPDEAAKA